MYIRVCVYIYIYIYICVRLSCRRCPSRTWPASCSRRACSGPTIIIVIIIIIIIVISIHFFLIMIIISLLCVYMCVYIYIYTYIHMYQFHPNGIRLESKPTAILFMGGSPFEEVQTYSFERTSSDETKHTSNL